MVDFAPVFAVFSAIIFAWVFFLPLFVFFLTRRLLFSSFCRFCNGTTMLLTTIFSPLRGLLFDWLFQVLFLFVEDTIFLDGFLDFGVYFLDFGDNFLVFADGILDKKR